MRPRSASPTGRACRHPRSQPAEQARGPSVASNARQMAWIARLIALALLAVLADATLATLHGGTLALDAAAAGVGLALLALALFWSRPWIAVAVALVMLEGAFAFGTI